MSDWIVQEAEKRYGQTVTKEQIFFYVYGLLHSPDYREAFSADLKKALPRLPLVERYEDFRVFSETGKALADLHLNYETCEPYPLEEMGSFSNHRVTKLSFPKKDKTQVVVNDTLTLRGIPLEAHNYVVNGRSPIEWLLDRYQVKTDKASGLVNDPNLWSPNPPDSSTSSVSPGASVSPSGAYIPDLLKRLVTLSLKTQELIARLPDGALLNVAGGALVVK